MRNTHSQNILGARAVVVVEGTVVEIMLSWSKKFALLTLLRGRMQTSQADRDDNDAHESK